MRVGVVGCGYWGAKHVRVLGQLPGVEQVCAIDVEQERLAGLARAFPSLVLASSLEEALPRVDAVVAATPPATHAAVAAEALCAGKHVLVEKPMATTEEQAQRLIELAEQNQRVLMVGHTFVYNDAVEELRSIVQSGELGDVLYIDTARLNLGLFQRDVNVLWDLAPHDVSIINHLLGEQPHSVQAWGSRHVHTRFEDVAYLRLAYSNGVRAQVHVSWLDPCKVRRVTVVGSRKMAVYNDLADQERLRIYDKGVVSATDSARALGVPPSYRYGGISSPYIDMREPLATELAHFVDCATTGRRPRTSGAEGLAVVRVLEGADESLRSGGVVQLAPVRAVPGMRQPESRVGADGAPVPVRSGARGVA